MHIKKLAVNKDNRILPILDLNLSYNSAEGHIDREELIAHKHDGIIKTTTGDKILFVPATYKDNMDRLKQAAAVIIPKDIGFIIAECGVTKNSIVIDAGAGTGGSACTLAAVAKKIYTYDINEKHLKTVRENVSRLDLDNIEVREGDITTIDAPEQADLVVIDIPDPKLVIPNLKKLMKQSGYAAIYTPQITQAQAFVLGLDQDFKHVTTLELIQRRWEVGEQKLRPKHDMLGHTAFLTIVRKFER